MTLDDLIVHHRIDEEIVYYWLMSKSGHIFASAYYFTNNLDYIYLTYLSVKPEHRNKGLGLQMQLIREQIGRDFGAKYAFLLVEKGTWMRKWYARRDYKYYGKNEDDTRYVWLKKQL